QLLQAERTLDQFRTFQLQEEHKKRTQIESHQKEKDTLSKELIKLYQEEKILERYKEKKKADWQKQEQREDHYLMDELGTQNFLRHKKERGGALLYILVPIALAAAALGLGMYTGVIHKNYLTNLSFMNAAPTSATATVEVASVTQEETEAFTLRELIGDPDKPMPELLQNMADERERLNQLSLKLAEKEKSLQMWETQLQLKEQEIGDLIAHVSDQVIVLRNLKTMREEALASEKSKRIQDLADAMAKNKKSKDIPQLLINLFESPTDMDEAAQTENKHLVLQFLRRYTGRDLESLLAAMAKTNPQTTALIIKAYTETSTEELYGITPEKAMEAGPIENSTVATDA
ncbi:MAG: hypothetical protein RBU29_10860, partial [bacterium]|nr:hypothetical protein [bacterium]